MSSKPPGFFRMLREIWRDYRNFGVEEYKRIEAQGQQLIQARQSVQKAENDMKEAQLKLIRSMNDAAERAQHSAVQSVSSSVDSSTRLLEPFLTENERTDNAQLATLQTMQAMQEAFDKQISRPDSLVARVMQQRAADLQRAARVATATAAPATGPDADVVSALQQLERAHAAADRVSADVERLTSAADPKPAATVTANNNNAR